MNRKIKEAKRITGHEVAKPISIVPVHLSIVSSLSLAFVLNNIILMPSCTQFVMNALKCRTLATKMLL